MPKLVHPKEKAAKAGLTIEFLQEHFAIVDDRLHLIKKWYGNQRLGLRVGTKGKAGGNRITVKGVDFLLAEVTWAVSAGEWERIERVDGDVKNDRLSNLRQHPSERGEKRCPDCGRSKDRSEFSRKERSSDGLDGWCRACDSKRKAERDFPRSTEPKFCKGCGETKKAEDFGACRRSSDGLFDKCRACDSKDQRRRNQTPERKAVLARNNRKYRAAKANAPGSFTGKEWREVLEFFGGQCIFCGKDEKMTKEHVIALSDHETGGSTDWIQNIAPSCIKCNDSKHNTPMGKWMKRKGYTEAEILNALSRWIECARSFDHKGETRRLEVIELVVRKCVGDGVISKGDAERFLPTQMSLFE